MNDELSFQLEESIRKDISLSQPMISDHVDILELVEIYQENSLPGFIEGITYLRKNYTSMRKIRGDGNCFYRGFLFSYLDNLLKLQNSGSILSLQASEIEHNRFLDLIRNSMSELISIGYEEFAIEAFYDVIYIRHK
jgi:ubiquitin thioesterase protein OTUB1